jgi:hypothetical protein
MLNPSWDASEWCYMRKLKKKNHYSQCTIGLNLTPNFAFCGTCRWAYPITKLESMENKNQPTFVSTSQSPPSIMVHCMKLTWHLKC